MFLLIPVLLAIDHGVPAKFSGTLKLAAVFVEIAFAA